MFILGDDPEELRDLDEYLSDTDELRGCVHPQSRPPGPEAMGPTLEALQIVLAPGGAAAVTASMIIAWLRSRRASVRISVRGEDGKTVDLDARGVSSLDSEGLQELTTTLLHTLDPEQRPPLDR
ncbi:hypothetical protein NRB20_70520 [Nocardia sp. RB20]|uniref:Uncharacterized protein n=1 Tax=Nocardia macrotermitis TaxID=2585198 RepID=A0A7K0DE59_9NOCA|nr:hypothetical protein [Nocardia macrotermitis]